MADVPPFKFALGVLLITPGVIDAFAKNHEEMLAYFVHHALGDWGLATDEEKARNESGIEEGMELRSTYRLWDGTKIWITTDADRSATTCSLPSENQHG